MRNGDNNLVILTLYIIGITYTFNQMVESIDEQVKIEFNKSSVDQQLKDQNLQDTIGISFGGLANTFVIDKPQSLSINIQNKSQDLAIYVDWDNCAFEEFDGTSKRVIRMSPDITRDLAVFQTPSLIVPGKTLSESVSSEGVFQLDKLSGTYTATKNPVANILKWKSSPVKAQKIEFNKFMSRKRTFEFSLDLVFRLAQTNVGVTQGSHLPPLCIVKCPFTVRKLPWTYALPWNKRR
ncbi:hypothetical protein [Mastigocladopsis repens]|uniref:hypothetical protein n=1 Tax=Mastigocladopsis repens TaxID=221287 RepID=UPI0002D8EDCB|nr:hypothetical protein [Mastigocladopsis repens]